MLPSLAIAFDFDFFFNHKKMWLYIISGDCSYTMWLSLAVMMKITIVKINVISSNYVVTAAKIIS